MLQGVECPGIHSVFILLYLRVKMIYTPFDSRGTTDAEKVARSDEVLSQLRLTHVADTYLGDELIRGVSTGERKVGLQLRLSL